MPSQPCYSCGLVIRMLQLKAWPFQSPQGKLLETQNWRGGGTLLDREMLTVQFYSSLSSETTTKITPWSLDYTSEFKQPFISGKSHPQTDWNVQDGILPNNMDSCYGDQSWPRWKHEGNYCQALPVS